MTVAVTVAMGTVGIVGTRPIDLHLYQKDGEPRELRSCQDSGAPCLARLPAWLGLPLTLPQPLDQTPLRPVKAGKLWAHVRQQHCQSARLANRAPARSDSWVALAKAGCPSLGQGCRKSGLILMVKSPGFLHAFRDMSVWSVWLFRSAGCLLSSSGSSSGSRSKQLARSCSFPLTSPA